jgi:hypothetical protein
MKLQLKLVVGLAAMYLLLFAVFGCNVKRESEYSLASELPESVVVLDSYSDTSGMDAFYLLRARYSNEDEIAQIIKTFQLLPDDDGVSDLSFAELFDERANIEWFPLPNANQKFEFNSVNDDGTFKAGCDGRYENALWIDQANKLLIIQSAGL